MKGLVFREFLRMVESEFGYEMVDKIIEDSHIASKGIYTSVGTYNHHELLSLMNEFGIHVHKSVNELMVEFGRFAFTVFLNNYPGFFQDKKSTFELLSVVEDQIHTEVLKLYPEAELPTFETDGYNNNEMKMIYRSERKMKYFAKGLMQGSLDYFGENAQVEMTNLKEDGSEVLFRIIKVR